MQFYVTSCIFFDEEVSVGIRNKSGTCRRRAKLDPTGVPSADHIPNLNLVFSLRRCTQSASLRCTPSFSGENGSCSTLVFTPRSSSNRIKPMGQPREQALLMDRAFVFGFTVSCQTSAPRTIYPCRSCDSLRNE